MSKLESNSDANTNTTGTQNKTIAEIISGSKIKPQYYGFGGYNPLMPQNSASRVNMALKQFGQAPIPIGAEPKIIQSTVDHELSKYVLESKVDVASKVVGVVPRYNKAYGINSVEYAVILYDIDGDELYVEMVKTLSDFNSQFGYKYELTDDLKEMYPGNIVQPGTKLNKSPAVSQDGDTVAMGRLINTMRCSIPGVAEDANVFSDEACEMFKFTLTSKVVVEYGNDKYPEAIYGNNLFPDIGDHVGDDNILMLLKDYDKRYSTVLNSKAIKISDPNFDYQYRAKGVVADIQILGDIYNKKTSDATEHPQVRKYLEAMNKYHSDLITIYENERANYYNANQKDLKVSPQLNRLLNKAYTHTRNKGKDVGKKKITMELKKKPIDLIRIEFTIVQEITPGIGFKVTDLNGSKSIISGVLPKEMMPVDKDGTRAHCITSSKSPVARTNTAVLYEPYYNAASRKAKELLIKQIKQYTGKTTIDDHDVHQLGKDELLISFCIVRDLISMLGCRLSQSYESMAEELDYVGMKEIVIQSINEEVYLLFDVGEITNHYEIIPNIEKSKYRPMLSEVIIDGKLSNSKIRIAPMYYLMLNKISNSWLSCPSAELNHYNLPVQMSVFGTKKFTTTYKKNPVRILSETETRSWASYVSPEALAELRNRTTNIMQHATIVEQILNADKPSNISAFIPSKGGGCAAMDVLNGIMNPVGMGLTINDDVPDFKG